MSKQPIDPEVDRAKTLEYFHSCLSVRQYDSLGRTVYIGSIGNVTVWADCGTDFGRDRQLVAYYGRFAAAIQCDWRIETLSQYTEEHPLVKKLLKDLKYVIKTHYGYNVAENVLPPGSYPARPREVYESEGPENG